MKAQDVILRAVSKQITFWEAANILRITPRHLRRWYARYRAQGFDGLYDRRRGRPSPKRVPWAVVEQVLGLYREKYSGFSVRHFHEKLVEQHGIALSNTCVKLLLQGAGLVEKARQRGVHRRRRVRRPMIGMMLHIDGSTRRWLGGEQWHDLIVVLDDASSEVYYAQLVEQESTATVLAALREVVERRGIFCALYRSGQSLLADPASRGDRRPAADDAGGAGAAGFGDRDDSGVFAAGAGTKRAELRHLAAASAAGAAAARDDHGGRSQPVSAGELPGGVQPALCGDGGAAGKRVCAGQRQGPGAHLRGAARAGGEPGQHGERGWARAADRSGALARHAGRLPGDRC